MGEWRFEPRCVWAQSLGSYLQNNILFDKDQKWVLAHLFIDMLEFYTWIQSLELCSYM